MLVSEVMKKPVITVSPEDTLEKVIEFFSTKNISGMPVVDKGKVVGIISESDVLNFLGSKTKLLKGEIKRLKEKLKNTKVRKLMKLRVYYVRDCDDIATAVKLMDERDVNRLPVLDSKKKLVGIITRGDIISALAKKEVVRVENRVLETDIDKLLRIIEEKEKVEIEKVSKLMKTPRESVEKWARILEEHGLVKVVYPPFGKPFLKIVKRRGR